MALSVVIACVRACRHSGLELGHAEQRDQLDTPVAAELGQGTPMLSQALLVNLTHRHSLTEVDEEAARLAPTAAGSPSSYPATAGPLGSGNPAAAAGEPVGSAPASNGTGHAGWFGGQQQQGDKVSCLGLVLHLSDLFG